MDQQNRYGFLSLIFLFAQHVCGDLKYRTRSQSQVSAIELASIFAKVLQSKRYQFQVVNDPLSRDEEYEKAFERMLKMVIFFADELFPGHGVATWTVSSLVVCQGLEV